MRGFKHSIILFIIAIVFILQPGTAWGTHWLQNATVRPHIPTAADTYDTWLKDKISVWCQDPLTGKIGNCRMRLALYWAETAIPPTDPAGHIKTYHVGERPLGLLEAVELTEENEGCEVVFSRVLCKSVTVNTDINTDGGIVIVDYLLPEVSGLVIVDVFTLSSGGDPGHMFHLETLYEVRWHDGFIGWNGLYYSIDYRFLPELEQVGEYHKMVRDPDSKFSHPKANYARQSTKNQLKDIAKMYYETSGYYLSVNDISLPMGGLFDLNDHWWVADTPGNGHVSHRIGSDADINQAPLISFDANSEVYGPTIPCLNDKKLRQAVKKIATLHKSWFTDLFCEPGGRKHIRF